MYCRRLSHKSLACGIPELIKPGENGELIQVQNPPVLAEKIKKALSNPWSPEAVRRSVEGRSWDSVAYEVLSVFGSVITMSCLERI